MTSIIIDYAPAHMLTNKIIEKGFIAFEIKGAKIVRISIFTHDNEQVY